MIDGVKLLWQAVISQAIHDATSTKVSALEKQSALSWLSYKGGDIIFVCDAAEISYETLRAYLDKKFPDLFR